MGSQLPRVTILPVRYLVEHLTASRTARSKSLRYVGVCLGHRSGGAITNQGGFLTRGRSRLTGGASSQFVTNETSLASPYGVFGSAVTSQGGLLTCIRSRLTGGASSQFVTNRASPVSPYGAPAVGGGLHVQIGC